MQSEFIDPVEDCPWRSPREILARQGYSPLPPADLDDQQIGGRLWELLYAAAGRRFFFFHTDHLSDREVYMLLWERWLDEPKADIPLGAETNTRLALDEFDAKGMTSEEIFLRYYAGEDDRELWRSTAPDRVLPPPEDPPYHRDHFLPVPPRPPEPQLGGVPDEDDPPETAEADPLGLRTVDAELAGASEGFKSEDPFGNPPDPALGAELGASEPENWTPPAAQLARENVPLLPPAEVTEETLTPVLWELLHNLALRGFYLLHTDHLSDRELYAELWQQGLREPAHLPGRNPHGAWFHDFLGSWGDEEMQLWLRYYASEDERAEHAREWPNDPIPPKEKLPFNRDWRLPKAPF